MKDLNLTKMLSIFIASVGAILVAIIVSTEVTLVKIEQLKEAINTESTTSESQEEYLVPVSVISADGTIDKFTVYINDETEYIVDTESHEEEIIEEETIEETTAIEEETTVDTEEIVAAVTETVEELKASPILNYKTHTVGKETMYSISTKYYGNGMYCQALMEYNKITSIHPGDVLIIPDENDETFQNIYNRLHDELREKGIKFAEAMIGKTMKAGSNSKYSYGTRMNPAVDVVIPSGDVMKNYTDTVDTSNFEYVGEYKITGYTPTCVHCCDNPSGICASGVQAIFGYSVAAGNEFEFGTTLYIEGYGYYVVEDRGHLKDNLIDIACPTHEACGKVTSPGYNIKVYIVPNTVNK